MGLSAVVRACTVLTESRYKYIRLSKMSYFIYLLFILVKKKEFYTLIDRKKMLNDFIIFYLLRKVQFFSFSASIKIRYLGWNYCKLKIFAFY